MGVGTSGGGFLPWDRLSPFAFCDQAKHTSSDRVVRGALSSSGWVAIDPLAEKGSGPRPISGSEFVARLGALIEDPELAMQLETQAGSVRDAPACLALLALAEQSVRMGIDYRSLGLGWNHPVSRLDYRNASHPSQTAKASRDRACESRRSIVKALNSVLDGEVDLETTVTKMFVTEIGLPGINASFSGVSAALEGELLLPLRALIEGLTADDTKVQTRSGTPLPKSEIRKAVEALTLAVLSKENGYAEWRYSNPVGIEQMRGLSMPQLRQWQQPDAKEHEGGLLTHEDDFGELGFFWATKIGGPSHGFDYEGHCILPLLSNARHKVILLSDEQWPHFPAGRAHFRLLWTTGDGSPEASSKTEEPRLWLEGLHRDSEATKLGIGGESQYINWLVAVLRHAMAKAEAMHVILSVSTDMSPILASLSKFDERGQVYTSQECILLRPSNGVVEASDELGTKHDWPQQMGEITEPIQRTLYVPSEDEDGVPEQQLPSSSVSAWRSRRGIHGGICM